MTDLATVVREYAPTSAGLTLPGSSTDENPFLWVLGDYAATHPIQRVSPCHVCYTYTGDAIELRYLFVAGSALGNALDCVWASLKSSRMDTQEETVAPIEEATVVSSPPANAALEAIAEWTRLSVDELAELFHSSRRSIYNWLDGKSIGRNVASRIASTYDVLLPLEGSRDAPFFRAWLMRGTPSPYQLIHDGQWQQLASLVERETLPLAAVHQAASESSTQRGEEPFAAGFLRTMMSALASEPPTQQSPKVGWQPHELTGLGASTDDAEDDA
jgi:hypothetical protein